MTIVHNPKLDEIFCDLICEGVEKGDSRASYDTIVSFC